MLGFFWKKKAKAVLRTKIIAIFLDNYIRTQDGKKVDEWGNDWKEKSFNESISFFKANEIDFKIKAKYELVLLTIMATIESEDDFSIYGAYKVLYKIYFDTDPSINELELLTSEYQNEIKIRGLTIK